MRVGELNPRGFRRKEKLPVAGFPPKAAKRVPKPMALVAEPGVCKAQPQQTATPLTSTKKRSHPFGWLRFFMSQYACRGVEPVRVSAKRKAAGGRFSAESGEAGTKTIS